MSKDKTIEESAEQYDFEICEYYNHSGRWPTRIEIFLAGAAAQGEIDAMQMDCVLKDLKQKLEEKEQVIKNLLESVKAFKIYGSDACHSCETDRINLYYIDDKCISCQRAYKKQRG